MRRIAKLITMVAMVCTVAAAQSRNGGSDEPAEVQLKRAVTRELIDGDSRAAIARYRDIEARYRGTDRRIAARALLHMAVSYERIGDQEADRTYRAVIRNYPDEPVAITARARVRLVARQGDDQPRRIATLPLASVTSISPDGSLAAGSSEDGLFLLNLETGQRIALRTTGTNPIFSPTGDQLAFMGPHVPGPYPQPQSVHIMAAQPGAAVRILVGLDAGLAGAEINAWLPGGDSIVATTGAGLASVQPSLLSISVATGEIAVLSTHEAGSRPLAATASPDGKYLAYSRRRDASSSAQGLFIRSLQGGSETEIATVAGSNGSPVWAPDGTRLVFVNTRSEQHSVWTIPMEGGRAAGPASVVLNEFGGGRLLGLGRNGTLHYFRPVANAPAILVADRAASRITQWFPGNSPSLSPDGKALAFQRMRAGGQDLIVRSLDDGSERFFAHPSLRQPLSPRWLPDQRGLVVLLAEPSLRAGTFHLLDLTPGVFRPLFPQSANGALLSAVGAVSRDGTKMYFASQTATAGTDGRGNATPWTHIVAVDLASGQTTPIHTFPGGGWPGSVGLTLNPDGTTLAVNVQGRVFTVGVDGSNYREIVPNLRTSVIGDTMRWLADGQTLLFGQPREDAKGWRLMRMPALGGPATPDGLDSTNLDGVPLPSLAPGGPTGIDVGGDGNTLVVTGRTLPGNELWALENVLARVNASR